MIARFEFPTLLPILLAAAGTVAGAPHGGQYRGPGDPLPPSSSSGASTSPSGGGNPTPGSGGGSPGNGSSTSGAGPSAPQLGSGGARSRAGGAPRGIFVGEDLSKWQYWWEFNKDDYLAVKDVIHAPRLVLGSDEMYMAASRKVVGHISARPSAADIQGRILPAIHRALREIDNRDVRSACLVALAKIGRDHASFGILPIFREFLKSPDQEIRETAALALGLSHKLAAFDDLVALITDSPRGRALTDRARVDVRTRSFAAYGLGLLIHAHPVAAVESTAQRVLSSVLADPQPNDRNLEVAAINALAQFVPPPPADARRAAVRAAALQALEHYFDVETGAGRDVVRAHVPPAIARLVGRGDTPLGRRLLDRFAGELEAQTLKSGMLQRSAAIALGRMALPAEQCPAHKRYSDALRRYQTRGKDPQARYFCLIALASIGGGGNRARLLEVLATGRRTLERPWAGLALGVTAFHARAAGDPVDSRTGEALHRAFLETSTPYVKGALAIALGLHRYEPAGPDILEHLRSHGHQDEMSGYLCVGLALMEFAPAKDRIADLLDASLRRPHRLRMAAVALGKLGDRRLTGRLMARLDDADLNVAKMAAVASALAQIGDRDSIDVLRGVLTDSTRPELARAFAVVALGGIADKQDRPWNAGLAADTNYRAAVETLVESGAGVLEIL